MYEELLEKLRILEEMKEMYNRVRTIAAEKIEGISPGKLSSILSALEDAKLLKEIRNGNTAAILFF
jgi:DNA-binding HxlR family transcriptional regulator